MLDPITLTEGDLYNIGDTVKDVTAKALEQFGKKQKIILGAIQIGLQELQTLASQVGMVSTNLAIGTLEDANMLRMRASSALVLPNGALTTENEDEKPTFSALKGMRLTLVALPREALHLL